MQSPTIKDIRVILTAPAGVNLGVVKVETTEPGLYGLGCATFAWRIQAVREVVENALAPFLKGRNPAQIEDIWQGVHTDAYWRHGPVMNNALSGVDMALWDIKGKTAGLPVYQLLGGACRHEVPVYLSAGGATPEEVADRVRKRLGRGIHHVRCQLDGYGGTLHNVGKEESAFPGNYFDPRTYIVRVVKLFEHMRNAFGEEVALLHDVHERLAPADAVRLARELEPFHLFFLEDPLPPERREWLRTIRHTATTPLAMGELFNHPLEWRPLITERLIDFIRVHVSHIGGITPAKKLAAFAETFGVRTAWHGPPDCSPVGHAANVHLDMCIPNFGIQEWGPPSESMRDVFTGGPVFRDGALVPSDAPGLGVDLDEEQAAAYPPVEKRPQWMNARLPDGSVVYP